MPSEGWGFVGAALTLAPFLLWLTQHSDLYFARAGQVSILSPDINNGNLLGTLFANIGKAAGMFFVEGDRIWRHNLAQRPVFEGALALAFMVGVGRVAGFKFQGATCVTVSARPQSFPAAVAACVPHPQQSWPRTRPTFCAALARCPLRA